MSDPKETDGTLLGTDPEETDGTLLGADRTGVAVMIHGVCVGGTGVGFVKHPIRKTAKGVSSVTFFIEFPPLGKRVSACATK